MSGKLRMAIVVGFLFCAAVAPASAQGITVSLGTPDLSIGRVSITVPVTVACAQFDPSLTYFASGVQVTVRQASGREIARGTGTLFGFLPNLLFACDGSEYTVSVVILADPAGPPFHGGPAVFSATVSATAGTPCFPGSTNCFFNLVGKSGTVDPIAINMH